jgi:Tfp pilus assembly protein FimT
MKIAPYTGLIDGIVHESSGAMMKLRDIYLVTAVLVACAVLLGGCAAPAASRAMVPETAAVERTHPYSVNVQVTGGRATEPTGTPQISNDNFDQAITETLTKTKTFAKVQSEKSGNYELNVIIFNVHQPSSENTATVTLETGWTLTNRLTGSVVWQKALRSTYTASRDSDVTFVGRLKKATEGAAKDTIKQGVTEIARLNL